MSECFRCLFNFHLIIYCIIKVRERYLMNILVIEDEYNLADVIKSTLESNNYQVEIETNGEDGYYKGLENTYDLIILDVMLPSMDGFTILKKLREDKKSNIGIRYMDKIIYTILLDENNSIRDVINNSNNNIDDSSVKALGQSILDRDNLKS